MISNERLEAIVRRAIAPYTRRGGRVAKFPGVEVEDLKQVARLAIVESESRKDPNNPAPLDAYLYLCARRAVHAEVARSIRGMRLTSLSELEDDADFLDALPDRRATDPAGDAERGENTDRFWETVRGLLTEAQYAAVVLHYRDGLSLDKTAARLGVSKDSVRDRLAGAVDKLRASPELESFLKDPRFRLA